MDSSDYFYLSSNSFDRVFGEAVRVIADKPDYVCSPRGMKIKEILVPTLRLTDPRKRLVSLKARKADYGFGVGEFLWYWNARSDLESLKYYNKRATQFSDDGVTVNSAYGARIKSLQLYPIGGYVGDMTTLSQWEACLKTLVQDPDSRRAILNINKSEDQARAVMFGSKDVPCTLTLQFFIRANKLILHVNMRSNDVIWGLTYDAFSFTLLQEAMMLQLRSVYPDLQLGEYIHTAGSLHLYEQHFDMAEKIIEEVLHPRFRPAQPMEPLSLEGLALLASLEEPLRTGKVDQIDTAQFSCGARWMAEQLNAHRRKRDKEKT